MKIFSVNRHSRESGNPFPQRLELDPRFRGDDNVLAEVALRRRLSGPGVV